MKNELNKHSNIVLPDLGSCYKKLKQTFTNLSDEELKGLLRPDSVKYYKKGELIYAEGTRIKGCYFIYSGIIKIYQTGHEGKEQIINSIRKETSSASVQSSGTNLLAPL